MSDTGISALILGIMLILPISALAARRLAWTTTLKMALAWVAIFAVGLVAVSQVDRSWLGHDEVVTGQEMRIPMAADGHFWAVATINGSRRRMLIDTGATTTAISDATANAAGIAPDDNPFAVPLDTANGAIQARRATIATLELGAIRAKGLPVVMSAAFGETDVLGMNFLSRLAAWRVENRTLILTPHHS